MIKDIVSEYYISQEIDATTDGIAVAIPENEWAVFATVSLSQLAVILVNIAAYVDLKKYKKNPRGPKKPRTDRTQFKGYPHVSTAKLLKGIPPKFIMAKAG